jgi:hypothetical protein
MLRTLTSRSQPRIIGTEHSPLPALGSADLLGGAQYGQGRCLCRNHSCTKTGLGLRGCLCKAIRLRRTRACSLIAALRPLGVVIGATYRSPKSCSVRPSRNGRTASQAPAHSRRHVGRVLIKPHLADSQQPAVRRTKRYGTSRRALFRLDASGLNHLGPLLGFVGDELAELSR